MKISINGQFVKKISLSGKEPEFMCAYGVFETIRTYGGKPFQLSAHLKRLQESAKVIGLKMASQKTITQYISKHTDERIKNKELRIKVIGAPNRIYVLSEELKIDSKIYKTGVKLLNYPYQPAVPKIKSLARIFEYQAHELALKQGCFDAYLGNECACANIFIIKNNTIITPNRDILYGVTRQVVLNLCKNRYRVVFKKITWQDIQHSAECFITQTSTGIVPVGKPGQITKELIKLFEYEKK
ncbi:MAG: aminotransferase class IV [Patescibacteria group bacterium]